MKKGKEIKFVVTKLSPIQQVLEEIHNQGLKRVSADSLESLGIVAVTAGKPWIAALLSGGHLQDVPGGSGEKIGRATSYVVVQNIEVVVKDTPEVVPEEKAVPSPEHPPPQVLPPPTSEEKRYLRSLREEVFIVVMELKKKEVVLGDAAVEAAFQEVSANLKLIHTLEEFFAVCEQLASRNYLFVKTARGYYLLQEELNRLKFAHMGDQRETAVPAATKPVVQDEPPPPKVDERLTMSDPRVQAIVAQPWFGDFLREFSAGLSRDLLGRKRRRSC